MAKIENRLKFLAEKYNIFLGEEIEDIITQLTEDGHEVTKVETANATMVGVSDDTIYAILDSVVSKTSEYEGEEVMSFKKNVRVHEDIFASAE